MLESRHYYNHFSSLFLLYARKSNLLEVVLDDIGLLLVATSISYIRWVKVGS